MPAFVSIAVMLALSSFRLASAEKIKNKRNSFSFSRSFSAIARTSENITITIKLAAVCRDDAGSSGIKAACCRGVHRPTQVPREK